MGAYIQKPGQIPEFTMIKDKSQIYQALAQANLRNQFLNKSIQETKLLKDEIILI